MRTTNHGTRRTCLAAAQPLLSKKTHTSFVWLGTLLSVRRAVPHVKNVNTFISTIPLLLAP